MQRLNECTSVATVGQQVVHHWTKLIFNHRQIGQQHAKYWGYFISSDSGNMKPLRELQMQK